MGASKPLISIIVSAKNEERWMPAIGESIKNQNGFNIGDLEVILSDGGSTDRTVKLAEDYGWRIIYDGKPGEKRPGNPAMGRNNGARNANADLLLFKDGDGPLPHPNFLRLAYKEICERELDVAGTLQRAYTSKNGFSKLRYRAYMEFFTNIPIKRAEKSSFPRMMSCMFARKAAHERINGFDETLEFGEENEYAKRIKEAGLNFGVLTSCGMVGYNMRKFEKNEMKMLLKNLYFVTKQTLGYESRRGETKVKYWDKD